MALLRVIALLLRVIALLVCAAATSAQLRPNAFDALKFGKFRDCHERWEAGERIPGVYTIYPNSSHPVQIYCNHSLDYTYSVIQRRYYGNVNFNRTWTEYQAGFGDLQGDHWVGLDTMNLLTSTGPVNLQVDMQDWAGSKKTVYLHSFNVANAGNYYRMTYSGFTGDIPDDLHFNNGMYFYTPDRADQGSCAVNQKCGWWFNYQQQCTYFLANGLYYRGGKYSPVQFYDGIYYRDWRGFDYSLKYVTLSIYK